MAENRKIRVLIADDFELLRQIIHEIIKKSDDIEPLVLVHKLNSAIDK